MIEYRAFKYPLYPTKEQSEELIRWIGSGRWIWNYAVQINQIFYESTKKFLWRYDLQSQLPFLKELYPWLKETPSSALQNKIQDYDKSLKKAIRDKKSKKKKQANFPKFKQKSDTQTGSIRISLVVAKDKVTKKIIRRNINFYKGYIKIPGIGWTRYKRFRPLQGRLLNITIAYEHERWWITCLCENDTANIEQPRPVTIDESEIIGIDLGLTTFAVLSDGTSIPTPKFYRNKLARLKKLQRRLSKKKKDSKNRSKARKKLNNLHFKIANQRNGFHVDHASSITKNYKLICIEDLNIIGMIKNKNLAKSIQDQAWGRFIDKLIYFSQKNGSITIKIDRWAPSTKTCSECNNTQLINLNERTYVCSSCGLIIDRDINAAINIKIWGKIAAQTKGIQIIDRAGTSRISCYDNHNACNLAAYDGESSDIGSSCASIQQEYLGIGLETAICYRL